MKEDITLRSIDEEKYVTLEELMRRTAYMDEKNMNRDEFEKLVANTVDEIAAIDMEYKKKAIESIQRFGKVYFVEEIEGEYKIGFINDCDRIVQVSLLADNLGQYLELSYAIKTDNENIEKSTPYLQRWFVNGRYKVCNDTITVYSVIPILDETFLYKQIAHSLSEIWDMNNVATSESINK